MYVVLVDQIGDHSHTCDAEGHGGSGYGQGPHEPVHVNTEGKRGELHAGAGEAAEVVLSGGIGSGVKIDPVAFLIVKDGFVRVMPVAAPAVTTVDRIVEMVPDLVDKVRDLIGKKPTEEEVVDPETL